MVGIGQSASGMLSADSWKSEREPKRGTEAAVGHWGIVLVMGKGGQEAAGCLVGGHVSWVRAVGRQLAGVGALEYSLFCLD